MYENLVGCAVLIDLPQVSLRRMGSSVYRAEGTAEQTVQYNPDQ